MACLIWTEPALADLDGIAEYIALENPVAASRFVQKVFDRVERLAVYPKSGKRPPELAGTHYREVVVAPCRIFYRVEKEDVLILYLMRSERLLRPYLLHMREEQG
jgi:plasmid stabilization system protein ParE